jgi:hypothetical protein
MRAAVGAAASCAVIANGKKMVCGPIRAVGFGHDRRDHIDELGDARGLQPVGVIQ